MRYREIERPIDRIGYGFGYWAYKPLARLAFGLRVTGRENIPTEGAAIIASNHRTMLDTLALPYAVKDRPVKMLARDDLVSNPALKWLLNDVILEHLDQMTISRGSFTRDNLRAVNSVLKKGRLLGIYPEQTRGNKQLRKTDRAANFSDFKEGVAYFAQANDVLTIPAAVSGLDNPL